VALYFLFDSVQVVSGGGGWISGMILGAHRGGFMGTASHGIIFVPLLAGVIALFYDARPKWAWALMWIGLGIVVVEILSRLEFRFSMKTSHLLLMLVMFGAGIGLVLRSFREEKKNGGPR
jgi:hypothetical protein